ncbi:hypothetical protein DENSPDRAFT_886710 [Dentipellis sp. KUC8613]|nr:hypothetical protein DENSPDRAFT_886710 [Dentipellis sp. KUC8613]
MPPSAPPRRALPMTFSVRRHCLHTPLHCLNAPLSVHVPPLCAHHGAILHVTLPSARPGAPSECPAALSVPHAVVCAHLRYPCALAMVPRASRPADVTRTVTPSYPPSPLSYPPSPPSFAFATTPHTLAPPIPAAAACPGPPSCPFCDTVTRCHVPQQRRLGPCHHATLARALLPSYTPLRRPVKAVAQPLYLLTRRRALVPLSHVVATLLRVLCHPHRNHVPQRCLIVASGPVLPLPALRCRQTCARRCLVPSQYHLAPLRVRARPFAHHHIPPPVRRRLPSHSLSPAVACPCVHPLLPSLAIVCPLKHLA